MRHDISIQNSTAEQFYNDAHRYYTEKCFDSSQVLGLDLARLYTIAVEVVQHFPEDDCVVLRWAMVRPAADSTWIIIGQSDKHYRVSSEEFTMLQLYEIQIIK